MLRVLTYQLLTVGLETIAKAIEAKILDRNGELVARLVYSLTSRCLVALVWIETYSDVEVL